MRPSGPGLEDGIFSIEEDTIRRAERAMADPAMRASPMLGGFAELLKGYKRIYKQLKRLVRMGDKQQSRLVLELEEAFESFVRSLATTIDAKHRLTAGHSHRVTEYVLFLGGLLGQSPSELNRLKYSALLHDIGKIAVPDTILTKCGPFTQEERTVMETHPLWTLRIMENIRLPSELKDIPWIAACHHEKLDGSGYPHGLKGDAIPFQARILAVCDVLDALTSRRDYPKYRGGDFFGMRSLDLETALEILAREQHTHFDPLVVRTALDHKRDLMDLHHALRAPECGE